MPQQRTDRIERGLMLNPPLDVDYSGELPRVICDTDQTHVFCVRDYFNVLSASDEATVYRVALDGTCTCRDSVERKEICKHAWACFIECAFLIREIRAAEASCDCDRMMADMEPYIEAAPEGIRRTVQDEYDQRVWALAMRHVKPFRCESIQ